MLRDWDDLPEFMRTEEVRLYYDKLKKKKISLLMKSIFDVMVSWIMLIILFPLMIVISIAIVLDSKGGVFFRQERVTQYGRKFRIHKFRTMVADAEKTGSQVTLDNDVRITRVGKVLRKYRLDELPQLIDIFLGNMSFVGTRPEVVKYVKKYQPEMYATLLLPAGITSETSILYKDENKMLEDEKNVDDLYVNVILRDKMKYNLRSLKNYNFFKDILTMIRTAAAVLPK